MPDFQFRDRLVDLLGDLHRLTGDRSFARAASALTGTAPGRKAIDDDQAVAYARSLIDAGMVESANQAAIMAARFTATHSEESARRRLLRKLRTK